MTPVVVICTCIGVYGQKGEKTHCKEEVSVDDIIEVCM